MHAVGKTLPNKRSLSHGFLEARYRMILSPLWHAHAPTPPSPYDARQGRIPRLLFIVSILPHTIEGPTHFENSPLAPRLRDAVAAQDSCTARLMHPERSYTCYT